ncbi:MBL-fold metallo-hydrolase superfamily [Candidatus Syntrophocurvum alkaliphilum]|uniref:MBL-fold metallo-hydrolase superfamily n=1 Tax=Candidatus Syntrophocurvum alkaliphilum TaxID=2293317 RepID=A0A6I6DAC4_9FIRM|nr:MBL fold metallo-hydrolase [Candidatus Syntrophocurvum alkaliphilum]QGT99339.1 MBL-fold metallo-hydrolase superfamily [Candidatus Syntrophocurvum alkaliphilum]
MKKLTENVIQLGNRHFNYFLVGQKEAAILECGVTSGVATLKSQWTKLQEKPHVKYIIAMHAHFDHVCGIPALQEFFSEAKIISSKEAQKVMAKSKIIDDFFYQDEKMSETLVSQGIIPDKPNATYVSNILVDQVVGENDIINLSGGIELKFLITPGHSPCSVACYLPKDQVMFLSDAAGFQISDLEIFPVFFQGYEQYIETIKRLMGYPTQVLGIPHERIWVKDEVNFFYQRALNAAQHAFICIEKMIDKGTDEQIIEKELFSYYYRGNLKIYTPENIQTCIKLLIRRVKECL